MYHLKQSDFSEQNFVKSIVALVCSLLPLQALPPVVPGLHGKHPLDEAQAGKLLIGELRCASCHDGMDATAMKDAPDLSNVGNRLTNDYLQRFIANPTATHHGTTMPNLLGSLSTEQRQAVAGDISAYLSSLKNAPQAKLPADDIDPYDGKELFHSVGCVACHSPRNEAGRELLKDGVISLDHLAGKYQKAELGNFIHQPLTIRPSGRMPDMGLTEMQAHALAAYLEGNNTSSAQPTASAEKIAAGRAAFAAQNCTACHQPEKQPMPQAKVAKKITDLNLQAGCLSAQPGKAPHFDLSDAQRSSIRKALEKNAALTTAADQIKIHLTRMNCISCHVRDDFGGVAEKLDTYFHSTEEALGNESRIPPPLTLVGAKLRPEWLRKVLYDGAKARPYMTTHMPQYGKQGLSDLADLLGQVDKMEPVISLPPPDKTNQPEMRDAAHEMLGDQGLNCIACHNYNGKESPGMKGIDLMLSYERLQPTWFYQYMINPAAFRPGIIMPSYWPQGQAARKDILDGDTDRQLRALWDNFSLGRSARDPSGLKNEPAKLVVTDKTRTYRGRSTVAGYRGIAVGFPGKLNYSFNAEYGSLTTIWTGEYVRVGWQGQGSGNFDPLAPPIALAADVAFLAGDSAPNVWPRYPQVNKERPVNPDPLYPRNHGYAFEGYSLDPTTDVPTFRYKCGDVKISDHSTNDTTNRLTRHLEFTSTKSLTLWMRPLEGNISTPAAGVFQKDKVKITVASADATLRDNGTGGKELLIKIPIKNGKTQLTLDYEILP